MSRLVSWVQLNERVVPASEASVSVFDRGFMYGDGVFDTMRAYAGRVFQLPEHLDRLFDSARALDIRIPRARSEIARDIASLIVRNGFESADAVVRVSVSRGPGVRGPSIQGATNPTYVVTAEKLPGQVSQRRRSGVRLSVVDLRRVSSEMLPAGAKHANYLNSILAHAEALARGGDDALLLTVEGALAECSAANIFIVTQGTVWTPDLDANILPGITRRLVLDLCRRHGVPVEEGRRGVEILHGADEAFVTNSVSEIVPVASIDDSAFPVPGLVSERLMELYREAVVEGLKATLDPGESMGTG